MITNELGLPEPLVNAIKNDGYSKGDCWMSTTSLIKPARIVALTREHGGQLSEDASDRIFALIGQAIHGILERGASERYMTERRFFAEVGGRKIGGQIDVFDTETATLDDYKITSRFTTSDGPKPEWIAQASINRLLMERNGVIVKAARIIAIFRDWSKMAAERQSDYPLRQVDVLDVPLWPLKQTEEYILARIAEHEQAAIEPPLCTPDERWRKPDKWAVMNKGKKRAVKLYENKEEAESALKDGQFIEPRHGEDIRCLHYCPVTAFCDYGRKLMAEKMEQ